MARNDDRKASFLPRALLLLGGAIAAIVLFLVLRPGDDGEPGLTGTTTGRSGAGGTTTTRPVGARTTSTTTPRPTTRTKTARIVVDDGRPVGGIRAIDVRRGDRVRIIVRSNVADEVHVHGYDRMRDVRPGRPATISILASVAGRFEIELEHRSTPIAQLDVRP